MIERVKTQNGCFARIRKRLPFIHQRQRAPAGRVLGSVILLTVGPSNASPNIKETCEISAFLC